MASPPNEATASQRSGITLLCFSLVLLVGTVLLWKNKQGQFLAVAFVPVEICLFAIGIMRLVRGMQDKKEE